jgi:hypothetical protein
MNNLLYKCIKSYDKIFEVNKVYKKSYMHSYANSVVLTGNNGHKYQIINHEFYFKPIPDARLTRVLYGKE